MYLSGVGGYAPGQIVQLGGELYRVEYDGLGGFSLKKIGKKIGKLAKKAVPLVGVAASFVPGGGLVNRFTAPVQKVLQSRPVAKATEVVKAYRTQTGAGAVTAAAAINRMTPTQAMVEPVYEEAEIAVEVPSVRRTHPATGYSMPIGPGGQRTWIPPEVDRRPIRRQQPVQRRQPVRTMRRGGRVAPSNTPIVTASVSPWEW